MNKQKLLVGAGIFAAVCVMAVNLQYAYSDYDILNISLHSQVLAQTSGSGSGGSGSTMKIPCTTETTSYEYRVENCQCWGIPPCSFCIVPVIFSDTYTYKCIKPNDPAKSFCFEGVEIKIYAYDGCCLPDVFNDGYLSRAKMISCGIID